METTIDNVVATISNNNNIIGNNNTEENNNENEQMMIERSYNSLSYSSSLPHSIGNTISLYNVEENYSFGTKEAQLEKDTSVAARLARMYFFFSLFQMTFWNLIFNFQLHF